MNPFFQKAIYSHVLAATLDGRVPTISTWLLKNKFQAIWPKVADGAYIYKWRPSITFPFSDNLTAAKVEIFHQYGLLVNGWGFVYGDDPVGEGNIAVQQIKNLKLDGWIIDAEAKFDGQKAAVANAYTITRIIRQAIPDIPLAYCGWPRIWNPSNGKEWHPSAVAKAFMEDCDVASPMVYPDGQDPKWFADILQQSFEQYKRITDKPFVPAGRAYIGDSGRATTENIVSFEHKVADLQLPGISWWFLDHAVKYKEIEAGLVQGTPFDSGPVQIKISCPTCGGKGYILQETVP
jgi:hypothetical protein